MKKQNTFIKFLIFVLVLLSTIFCIVLTNQYRIVVFSIAFMGFVFSFLSCTKYLIFNKQEDKIVLLNSYFNDLITEKVKNFSLCKYKSCTISQRNTSFNKDSNLTNEPMQYANEFYLRIFTENGIIIVFRTLLKLIFAILNRCVWLGVLVLPASPSMRVWVLKSPKCPVIRTKKSGIFP